MSKRKFVYLKRKYKATQYRDSSVASNLYKILQKSEVNSQLTEEDINWLKSQGLSETLEIAQKQYAAYQEKYPDTLKSKIRAGKQLNESEVEWIEVNNRQDIRDVFREKEREKELEKLQDKYGIANRKLPIEPFYNILSKLDKGERLDKLMVAQLKADNLFSRHDQITVTYYQFEANFYEKEFQRTKDKWLIPKISSYWRKADQPSKALEITGGVNLANIKDNGLKSSILVTRGAAFRDVQELNEAKNHALQAIDFEPESHHLYTLTGAICFDLGKYLEGDDWFEEARKRGAKAEDIDEEIKRVVRETRNDNKRRDILEYLLKKDSVRYAWARHYLHKPIKKDK